MDRQYTGGPEPAGDRIMRWLRPRGGTILDGVRLAVINAFGLVVAIIWVAAVSLITRLVDRFVPIPVLFTGFFAVVVALAAAVFIWYRYGSGHGEAARMTGSDPNADVFAAISASPFIAAAVVIASFSIIGLFVAAITFSGSRFVDSLRQLGVSIFFLLVAAANLVIVRFATGGERSGS